MAFLTVTPLPSGAVRLDFGEPAGISIPSIARFDANGNANIRTTPGTFPLVSPGTVTDWEAALNGPVVYTAGGTTVRTTFDGILDRAKIIVPYAPAQSFELESVTGYDSARDTLGTVHIIPGRPDPLISLGGLTTRRGTLEAKFLTAAEAAAAEATVGKYPVLMLKLTDHSGLDMFFHPGRSRVQAGEDEWILSIEYIEVKRPALGINSGTWTLDALKGRYATFADARAAFPTFADMAADTPEGGSV